MHARRLLQEFLGAFSWLEDGKATIRKQLNPLVCQVGPRAPRLSLDTELRGVWHRVSRSRKILFAKRDENVPAAMLVCRISGHRILHWGYSPPIRAPFSATERFISSTANTSAPMTTA